MFCIVLVVLAGCADHGEFRSEQNSFMDTGVGGVERPTDTDSESDETDPGAWSLSGTINGILLQDDAKSAVGVIYDHGSYINTAVWVSNQADYCSLLLANDGDPCVGIQQRLMRVVFTGTASGAYETPGEARLEFFALDEECHLLDAVLDAESGSIDVSNVGTSPASDVEFGFNVGTDSGAFSGWVRAPFCALITV